MKKKLFVTAILLAFFSFVLIPFTFAEGEMDNAVNGIRNAVGGAENVVEDAGEGVVNGIRSGMNTIGNGANNVVDGVENGMNNNGDNNRVDNMSTTGTMTDNNGYDATRTSTRAVTEAGTGLFGNVANNVWTWVILAIVGIVIVALVMYYARQNNITTYTHNDDNNNNE